MADSKDLLLKGHMRVQMWLDEQIALQCEMRDGRGYVPQFGPGCERCGVIFEQHTQCLYDEGYLEALIALRTYSDAEFKRICELRLKQPKWVPPESPVM